MKIKSLLTAVALAATSLTALAQGQAVEVQAAWARATVKGQMATGAFMTLISKDGARLVGVASPVAGVAQVHEMKMEGGVMKMAEVKGGLELPAGKAIELKPGGFHIMLMDLKAPLMNGSMVPLTLMFKDSQGASLKTEVKLPVQQLAAPAMMDMGKGTPSHDTHGMHGKP